GWPRSVMFVDTPGAGVVEKAHETVTGTAVRAMDVAVLVLTADPPISAAEGQLLRVAVSHSAATVLVLNKTDVVDPADLPRVCDYTMQVAADVSGASIEVIAAVTGGRERGAPEDRGVATVRQRILQVAADAAEATLAVSLTRRMRGLIEAEVAELDVALSLLNVDAEEARRRAGAFRAGMGVVRAHAELSTDVVHAGVRAVDRRLDASASTEVRRLRSVLSDIAATEAAARDEASATAQLVALATESAERWRRRAAEQVSDELEGVSGRATAMVATAVDDIRGVALRVLGVDLTLPPPRVELPQGDRFFYITSDLADAASALSAALRRGLPGRLGRRLVLARLQEKAATLAERQIGRARADLRMRLAAADRDLVGQLTSVVAAVCDRVGQGAESAARLAARDTARQRGTGGQLRERRRTLRRVAASLDAAAEEDMASAGTRS
ncbi:MAG: GTP-binding protein, partial [Sciscionella sp.]